MTDGVGEPSGGGNARATPALQLPVGAAGKVGLLEVTLAPARGKTRVVAERHRVPLQMLRAFHYDRHEPEMAYVTVVSPVGGLVQGDRLRLELHALPAAAVHATTAAATHVYAMAADEARLDARVSVGAGAYVEYFPDPLIPHRDARYVQEAHWVVDPGGVLVAGEVLLAGRTPMGERFAYERLDLRLRALRPSGTLLFTDRLLLEPGGGRLASVGGMRRYDALGSFFCLCGADAAARLEGALRAAAMQAVGAAGTRGEDVSPLAGVSRLPADCGLFGRFLCSGAIAADRLMHAWWRAARSELRGTEVPERRKG